MHRPMCSANPPKIVRGTSATTSSVSSVMVAVCSAIARYLFGGLFRLADRVDVRGRQLRGLCVRRSPPLGLFGVDPDVVVGGCERLADRLLELLRREPVLR